MPASQEARIVSLQDSTENDMDKAVIPFFQGEFIECNYSGNSHNKFLNKKHNRKPPYCIKCSKLYMHVLGIK